MSCEHMKIWRLVLERRQKEVFNDVKRSKT